MRRQRSLAKILLYLSLAVGFAFLVVRQPPVPFYAFLLAPIALSAVLYEFTGGTLVALAAIAAVGVLIALDPDAARRARKLQEAWPILSMYLVVGPVVGWLAARERERDRGMVAAARHLHAVQEITQAINTSLDLDETIQTIFQQSRRLFPFQKAAVILRQGETIQVMAVSEGGNPGKERDLRNFPLQGTAAGWAIQQGRVWSGGPAEVARHPDTRALCPEDSDCIIIPLKFQGRVIGAFMLGGPALEDMDAPARTSLMQISEHIASAIEHARLYESERNWSRQLAAISDAAQEITEALDPDRTLRLVMEKAAETMPMDAGALFQLEPGSMTYRVAVSYNLSPEIENQIDFSFEEGVPGWVVKNRESLVIPDAAQDPRVHPYIVELGVKSVLATVLLAREQVVGVLTLYSKSLVNAFSDEALRLAEVFSSQAAVAIENARLVDELIRAADELEARVERRTRQLEEKQVQIVRAEKLAVVGRLAATVAHEVNNPLQSIALQLDLIAEELGNTPALRRLEIVRDELTRIAGIVQRLLDFQRPKAGAPELQRIPELLLDVLALADKKMQQAGIRVITDYPDDLPPIQVVSDQIKQVFLNLVLNAVEAMPEGGDLSISAQQVNGMIQIQFSDTGVGMEPEVQAHLFEPFFSTKSEGTGLGLAVSHEIVTRHGGRLDVVSSPGEGSSFFVRLPALAPEEIRETR